TTYRAMAEDVLARCVASGLLPPRGAGQSASLRLVGAPEAHASSGPGLAATPGPHLYGVDAAALAGLPGAEEALAPGLTEAMVRFAARHEYALTVEDVLARRSRLLCLAAELAGRVAPRVAEILAEETGGDPQLAAFDALARSYRAWPA
ncbi:glycerol-3-phosphate dehydrogenase C-terminal domain-containing protein, partial [Leptospira sp. 96542]|nr:glycerol-3-phosphate dehydrogenase C-terminal domain-containing protein [Leptospira sp. 96542]